MAKRGAVSFKLEERVRPCLPCAMGAVDPRMADCFRISERTGDNRLRTSESRRTNVERPPTQVGAANRRARMARLRQTGG
jgi:hypothetical protein